MKYLLIPTIFKRNQENPCGNGGEMAGVSRTTRGCPDGWGRIVLVLRRCVTPRSPSMYCEVRRATAILQLSNSNFTVSWSHLSLSDLPGALTLRSCARRFHLNARNKNALKHTHETKLRMYQLQPVTYVVHDWKRTKAELQTKLGHEAT